MGMDERDPIYDMNKIHPEDSGIVPTTMSPSCTLPQVPSPPPARPRVRPVGRVRRGLTRLLPWSLPLTSGVTGSPISEQCQLHGAGPEEGVRRGAGTVPAA